MKEENIFFLSLNTIAHKKCMCIFCVYSFIFKIYILCVVYKWWVCVYLVMLYVVCICNLASIYPNFLSNFQILLLSISFKI